MKAIKLYKNENGSYSTNKAASADHSGWYVQSTDHANILQENNELRYQIEKYESVLCGTCRGAGTVLISIDDGVDCPECVQQLADIRAEAVNDFWSTVVGAIENNIIDQWDDLTIEDFRDIVKSHIDHIRGQTK